MSLGQTEYTKQSGIDMTIPASAHVNVSAGADFTVDPVPRCLYIAVTGTVIVTDWNDVAFTYTAPVGVFPFRPKSLAAGTAIVLAWY